MTDVSTQLVSTLKQEGFSLTKPRQLVFEALQNYEPQTMRELVARCGANLDRASLYRTIALFEQLGIVQRLQIGWKYKLELSDAFSHHHHHFSCVRCGRLIALEEDPSLEARLHELAKAANFVPQDHQLEIRGLCDNCSSL